MDWLFEEKRITVIIPVYNAEKYLKRSIDSVMAQTYKYFEIICIDDGSTDNSGAILDSYAESYQNIKVLHIENKGVGNARNLGIERANGDYIYFIDADDQLEPLLFEKVIRILEEDPADICVFDMVINRYEHIRMKHSIRNVKEGNIGDLNRYNTFADYFLNGPRSACNRFFSRSFIQKEAIAFSHLRNGEDGIFIIEAYSKARKIIYLPYAGYHYILNKTSATQASRDENFIQSICLFYDSAQRLSERFSKFDYMKVINTHFLNAYISTVGDFVISEKSVNKVEQKKRLNEMLLQSPYYTALKNIDYSYLNIMSRCLLCMGKTTYEKILLLSTVKRIIKNVVKYI